MLQNPVHESTFITMKESIIKLLIFIVFSGFCTSFPVHAQDTLDIYPSHKGALLCWSELRTTPRLLKIYYLKINLQDPDLHLITMPGDDPDGDGPAESALTAPTNLFNKYQAIAAINANAFAGLPGTEKDTGGWYQNRPVDIQGMVVSNGKIISPLQTGRTAFWLDRNRRPHIGDPNPNDSVWQAVSDWSGQLIVNNQIIPNPGTKTLHPRTALGFDDSGNWLLFIIVDGRQPGYSEGVSLYELASIFREQGCTQSLNLDGGGSSIMLIKQPGKEVETLNKPSDKHHRPVPLLLGIR